MSQNWATLSRSALLQIQLFSSLVFEELKQATDISFQIVFLYVLTKFQNYLNQAYLYDREVQKYI